MISFQLGEWDDVDDATSTALASDAQSMAALRVHTVRARLLLARGDVEGAERHLVPALQLATQADDVQHGAPAHMARAEVLAARGERRAAIDAAAAVVRSANAADDTFYGEAAVHLGVEIAADLAEDARARHDDDATAEAVALAEPFLARARRLVECDAAGTLAPRTRGELASIAAEHRRLDGVHDVDAWRLAVATWHEIGEPYPEARARVRLAEALLSAQAPRAEIEAQLRAAAAVADRLRAASLRADADRVARWARVDIDVVAASAAGTSEAARPEESVPVPFALTPRELQVLAFVADGRTNRQIAEALFINQKTASVHVSNILTKLGVSNRAEAAAVAHRVGLAND